MVAVQNENGSPDENLSFPLRRPRGLLVEDAVVQLDRRRQLLRLRNIDAIPATSKTEAIDRLQSVDYLVDVVVADLNLQPDSGSLGGIDVAEAVSEYTGDGVPIFAYSGKTDHLPPGAARLFQKVVLKSDSAHQATQLFDLAATAAEDHFRRSVARAKRLAKSLVAEPKLLNPRDVAVLRDIIVASREAIDTVTGPETVGVLLLPAGVGLPYRVSEVGDSAQYRVMASILGHEYLYGYGDTVVEARGSLTDVLIGFSHIVSQRPNEEAFGASRRMRQLFAAIEAAS